MADIEVGSKVRDRFKVPRPGDPGTTGLVVELLPRSDPPSARVRWDDPGPFQPEVQEVPLALLVVIEVGEW